MFWAALLLFSGHAVAERDDSDLMSFVTVGWTFILFNRGSNRQSAT